MLKTAFQSIGVFLLVVYIAVAGFIWRTGNPPMRFNRVNVVICDSAEAQFIEAKDLYAALKADSVNPLGKVIADYDISHLENLIKRNPLVREAHCYQTPDSALRIDIYQRHPIMRIKSQLLAKQDCYLDTEGELMRYKYSHQPVQVPIATGYITKEIAEGPLYTLAVFLQEEEFWRNYITQIYVEQNGDIRLVPRVGDHTILLGDADNIEGKFENLSLFYEKVLSKTGWEKYKSINLKFKGQVVAEKR